MKKVLSIFVLCSLFTAQAGWFDTFYSGTKKVFSVSKQAVSEPAVIGAALFGYTYRNYDRKNLLEGVGLGSFLGASTSILFGIPGAIKHEKSQSLFSFFDYYRTRRSLLYLYCLGFIRYMGNISTKHMAIASIALPVSDKLIFWFIAKRTEVSI